MRLRKDTSQTKTAKDSGARNRHGYTQYLGICCLPHLNNVFAIQDYLALPTTTPHSTHTQPPTDANHSLFSPMPPGSGPPNAQTRTHAHMHRTQNREQIPTNLQVSAIGQLGLNLRGCVVVEAHLMVASDHDLVFVWQRTQPIIDIRHGVAKCGLCDALCEVSGVNQNVSWRDFVRHFTVFAVRVTDAHNTYAFDTRFFAECGRGRGGWWDRSRGRGWCGAEGGGGRGRGSGVESGGFGCSSEPYMYSPIVFGLGLLVVSVRFQLTLAVRSRMRHLLINLVVYFAVALFAIADSV